MAELKPRWRRLRFHEMVTSAGATRKARGWTAAAAGVERYVGLEHLDANSPTIRRWGSPEGVGENSDLRPFESGDVILARRGIEQRKVGFATFDGVASGHALVFRARTGVLLPEFLPHFLLSDAFMGRVDQFSAGSLSKTVNLTTLLRLEFALPPLEEQERMVELLSASMESLRTTEVLEREARAVVSALAKHASSLGRLRPVGTVAKFVTSGSRGWAEHYSETGAWFVRVTNLRPDSTRLDLTDLKYVNPPAGAEGTRTRISPNDVLVAITGEYLGMVAHVPDQVPEGYVNQHVAIVRVDPALADSRFVACALTAPSAQREVWRGNDGGTKPGLTLSQVRALPIPDLPLEVQRRIGADFEVAEMAAEAIAARLRGGLTRHQSLLSTLLSGADCV